MFRERSTGRARAVTVASGPDYRGRIGAFEVMMVQEHLRKSMWNDADREELMKAAREESGYVTMAEHARALVESGIAAVDRDVIRTLMTI